MVTCFGSLDYWADTINLSEKKIRDLYDLGMPAEKKKGLNFSDLVRISEAFNVSYDFMLTGNGE